jgi:hypothetical protein
VSRKPYAYHFPTDKFHGTGGPVHVEKLKQTYMDKYFLDAVREKGFPIKDSPRYKKFEES